MIRFRARTPDGRQAVVQIDDNATIRQLRETICEKVDIKQFELKAGFPPKVIKLEDYSDDTTISASGLQLNNESIQVIPPATPAPAAPPSQPLQSGPNPTKAPAGPSKISDPRQETPEIPIPSESSTLVLRVMPDDNSCLFRAITTAVSGDQHADHVTKLRWHVADYIRNNPSVYSAAILGKEPAAYCAWIQQENSWGGDIELDILSRVLGVEIDACIVQPFSVQRYNEGASERIVLIYSGIHYDTVAVSPDPEGDLGAELDMRRFEVVNSDWVLEGTRKLCEKLAAQGYMTNTSTFGIMCKVCGWKGKGEREATKHAMETGHMELEEIR
ncbi:uncharacterized protein HMPREF1541_06622 [Cyphellophora europaea CBS 101466]|uniref:Ubiquitin thioesterase OTU n=1 Tax=Cyphellophora europaea (strain CBS 101466) TaxID=1220924 RepID=W2RQI9_CYPE1|nr:uncharacterized protein HMPREF1541_06622 [Cyphellophora europaea CBS 101466]ETN38585.1 hypothetical protein HMPREF1541_06622 [Cyphellophora europaea CBS 101466]